MYDEYYYGNLYPVMEGGKINPIRTLAKIQEKANPVNYAFKNKKVSNFMGDVGQFTAKQLLPAVISTGIPLASAALGAAGTMAGGPILGQVAQQTSQNLMTKYIPQSHQSKSKYFGMLGDALASGASGDFMSLDNIGNQMMYDVSNKLNKQPTYAQPVYAPVYDRSFYEPSPSPYNDMLIKLLQQYQNQPQLPVAQPIAPPVVANDLNDDNDAMYKSAQLGNNADSMTITTPPYQQREGSMSGLLGAGVKRKRGRPKKVIQEVEIIRISKPSDKFSKAKNASLEQLLDATEERRVKEERKMMKKYLDRQGQILGFGGNRSRPIQPVNPNFGFTEEQMRRRRIFYTNMKNRLNGHLRLVESRGDLVTADRLRNRIERLDEIYEAGATIETMQALIGFDTEITPRASPRDDMRYTPI